MIRSALSIIFLGLLEWIGSSNAMSQLVPGPWVNSSAYGGFDQNGKNYYQNNGGSILWPNDYGTGQGGGVQYRSFYSFPIPTTVRPIAGGRLAIWNPNTNYNGTPDGDAGFFSVAPSETLSFWDVSTAAATLKSSQSGAVSVYNDLGTGSLYGTKTVNSADDGTYIITDLNAVAGSHINSSRGGTWSAGCSLSTIVPAEGDQYVFGYTYGSWTGGSNVQLQLMLDPYTGWSSSTGGSWQAAANWSPNDVPNLILLS